MRFFVLKNNNQEFTLLLSSESTWFYLPCSFADMQRDIGHHPMLPVYWQPHLEFPHPLRKEVMAFFLAEAVTSLVILHLPEFEQFTKILFAAAVTILPVWTSQSMKFPTIPWQHYQPKSSVKKSVMGKRTEINLFLCSLGKK